MKNIALLGLVLGFISLSLAACQNTFHGFGRDMETNGQKIQKSI